MSQQPDNQNNLLIAVVLSMIVMLGWQFFYAGPQMKEQQEKARQEQLAREKAGAPKAGQPAATPGAQPPAGTTLPAPVVTVTRQEAIAQSPRLPIDTPALKGSISLKGGLIDDLTLKNYRVTVDPNSPNVVLLSPLAGPDAYFAEYGWMAPAN